MTTETKKKKKFFNFRFGATATVWLSAFVTVICITAQAADRIIQLLNIIGENGELFDLVQGDIPMDKIAMAWAGIIAVYCIGTEAVKIIRAKSLEGSDVADGKFKKDDTEKMKKIMICTLLVSMYGLIVTTFGTDVNVWWLLATFFVNAGCYILGCRTTQSVTAANMTLEDFDDGNGVLDENDDRNFDGVLDYKDIIIAFKEKGKDISEEEAKKIAKSLFGETGEIILNNKKVDEQ